MACSTEIKKGNTFQVWSVTLDGWMRAFALGDVHVSENGSREVAVDVEGEYVTAYYNPDIFTWEIE